MNGKYYCDTHKRNFFPETFCDFCERAILAGGPFEARDIDAIHYCGEFWFKDYDRDNLRDFLKARARFEYQKKLSEEFVDFEPVEKFEKWTFKRLYLARDPDLGWIGEQWVSNQSGKKVDFFPGSRDFSISYKAKSAGEVDLDRLHRSHGKHLCRSVKWTGEMVVEEWVFGEWDPDLYPEIES